MIDREALVLGLMIGADEPHTARQMIEYLTGAGVRSYRGQRNRERNLRVQRSELRWKEALRIAFAGRVLRATATYYLVDVADLTGPRKTVVILEPRYVAIWVMYQHGLGVSEIGRAVNRDHATIINSVQRVERSLRSDLSLRQSVKAVTELVTPTETTMGLLADSVLSPTYPPSEGTYPQESATYPLALGGNVTRPSAVDYDESLVEIRKTETTSPVRARAQA